MLVSPLVLAAASAAQPAPSPIGFDLSEPTPATAALTAADEPPVMHKWTGAVNAGATVATGNTESTNATAGADAEYRREDDRFTLKFQWNYTEDDDVVTQRRIYGAAKYDYFFSEKTYALVQTNGEYDTKANLDLRATLGVGVGRQFREDEKWKLSGEVGLTYIDENFEGTVDDTEYLAARLAYGVEYKAIDKWLLAQTGELYPSLEDKDDVYGKLNTKARLTLTEKMFAQFEWIYSWDNTPATDAERVDNLYLFTLGWVF